MNSALWPVKLSGHAATQEQVTSHSLILRLPRLMVSSQCYKKNRKKKEIYGHIWWRAEGSDKAIEISGSSCVRVAFYSGRKFCVRLLWLRASLVAQKLKCLLAMQETWVWFLGWQDPLEKEMATHSSVLAWRIPGMEEPGGLQSTGSQRIGHNWATSLHFTLAAVWGVHWTFGEQR